MMNKSHDTIFLLSADRKLERVPNVEFETEDLLQGLIAEYPELIVGEQIDPDAPPQWLLVAREAGIPDRTDRGSRWAVDHLLLDQFGRPTFVEVKRSSNPQIRREIVGQILDYAANAIVYWPGDRIRALATEQFGGAAALDEYVVSFSGAGGDVGDSVSIVERFWETVETNLREGNVRLLFAADVIPRELRRIIEFLNEKMSTVEVLGVEVKQYRGNGLSALVPRVVGQTETARDRKKGGGGGQTSVLTAEKFLAAQDGEVLRFWRRLIAHAEQSEDLSLSWGKALCIRVWSPASEAFRSVIYSNALAHRPHITISREYIYQDYPRETEWLRAELEKLGFDSSAKWRTWTPLDEPDSVERAQRGIDKLGEFIERVRGVTP